MLHSLSHLDDVYGLHLLLEAVATTFHLMPILCFIQVPFQEKYNNNSNSHKSAPTFGCISHQSDRLIRVRISHQSDRYIMVCNSHQSDRRSKANICIKVFIFQCSFSLKNENIRFTLYHLDPTRPKKLILARLACLCLTFVVI